MSKTFAAANNKVKHTLVDLLTRESVGGVPVSLVCATFLSFAFSSFQQNRLIWFASFAFFVLVRLFTTIYWFKHSSDASFNLLRYRVIMRTGVVIIALHWCSYALIFLPNITNPIELALTVIIFTALSGGSTSTLSGDKFVCVAYISLMMLPHSVLLLLSQMESVYYLGLISFGFYIVILSSAVRACRFTADSVMTKYEKDDLVKNLELRVQQRTAEIEKLSNIDSLTSLYNRAAFSNQLNKLMRVFGPSNKKLAILFIDLDGFKSINDIHGHEVGDQVLREVAIRLENFYSDKGVLCRWGGDEFIAVSEYLNQEKTIEQGLDLTRYLAQPIECAIGDVGIDATIGVSVYPDHGLRESELISHADIAMYEQKGLAKGRVMIFNEKMRDELASQLSIKNELANALQNNEFFLEYQPIVNIESGKVLFVEALIRWRNRGKVISPLTFIPIAEQYGLIHDISAWVAKTIAEDLNSLDNPLSVNVSINISVAELTLVDFMDDFHRTFCDKNLKPHQICIEVTESVLTQNSDLMLKHLAKLRALGYTIAIDDFGTGYSSLSQLQQLGPSIIKIDKSFVDTWENGGKAIVKAVCDISNELNFRTVIEGLETAEQVQNARNIGVPFVQGFYFAKPMHFTALQTWLAS